MSKKRTTKDQVYAVGKGMGYLCRQDDCLSGCVTTPYGIVYAIACDGYDTMLELVYNGMQYSRWIHPGLASSRSIAMFAQRFAKEVCED